MSQSGIQRSRYDNVELPNVNLISFLFRNVDKFADCISYVSMHDSSTILHYLNIRYYKERFILLKTSGGSGKGCPNPSHRPKVSWSSLHRCTDTGLLELKVQFVGIGKFEGVGVRGVEYEYQHTVWTLCHHSAFLLVLTHITPYHMNTQCWLVGHNHHKWSEEL